MSAYGTKPEVEAPLKVWIMRNMNSEIYEIWIVSNVMGKEGWEDKGGLTSVKICYINSKKYEIWIVRNIMG